MNEWFAYIHKHSYRFFINNFSWSLIKKTNKLVYSFESIADIFSYNIVRLVIWLPFIIITIWTKNIMLWSVFLGFVILYSILQYIFYKINIPYEISANEKDSKTTGELSDTITNSFNILTFASLPREIKKFGETVNERKKITVKKRMISERLFFISTILLTTFEILVIYFCIIFRWKWIISTGTIILAQSYIFKVFDELFNIRSVLKWLNKAMWEAAEMIEILDTPNEIVDHTNKKININAGKIEFINTSFKYGEEWYIFKDLNLRIKPGEKVAIVGKSWSGKTTLLKLLFRFFDIESWEIRIDDQNIAQVTQESLRGSMSMVPQDPVLFHRSLRDNIAYGKPDATEEEIIAAAKMARCHEFISKMKNGYDTLVGERGVKLSWGERQRVAIARAILHNKRILMLDEATSSLDSESEKFIQEAIDEVMKNKTVIVVAHRLSTIMKMDKIIVMDKWEIVEKGSHKELVAKPNWIYKNFREIQSGGFIE